MLNPDNIHVDTLAGINLLGLAVNQVIKSPMCSAPPLEAHNSLVGLHTLGPGHHHYQ